jgi:cell division protein FtsB
VVRDPRTGYDPGGSNGIIVSNPPAGTDPGSCPAPPRAACAGLSAVDDPVAHTATPETGGVSEVGSDLGPVTSPSGRSGGGSRGVDGSTGAQSEPPIDPAERARLRVVSGVIAVALLYLFVDGAFGSQGAVRWNTLTQELDGLKAELAMLERETTRDVYRLRALQNDPAVYRRLIADELGAVPQGARLYRFDEPTDGSVPPAPR